MGAVLVVNAAEELVNEKAKTITARGRKKIYSGPSAVPSAVQQSLDVSHKFALFYWFWGGLVGFCFANCNTLVSVA